MDIKGLQVFDFFFFKTSQYNNDSLKLEKAEISAKSTQPPTPQVKKNQSSRMKKK